MEYRRLLELQRSNDLSLARHVNNSTMYTDISLSTIKRFKLGHMPFIWKQWNSFRIPSLEEFELDRKHNELNWYPDWAASLLAFFMPRCRAGGKETQQCHELIYISQFKAFTFVYKKKKRKIHRKPEKWTLKSQPKGWRETVEKFSFLNEKFFPGDLILLRGKAAHTILNYVNKLCPYIHCE